MGWCRRATGHCGWAMSRRNLIGHRQGSSFAGLDDGAAVRTSPPLAPTVGSGPPPRHPEIHRRQTILVLLLLGLAPLVAAAVLASTLGGVAIIDQVNTRAANSSRQAAAALDQVLSARLTAMDAVANDLPILSLAEHNPGTDTAQATADLDALARSAPQTWGVALTDAGGSPVAEVGTEPPLIGLPDNWRAELAHGGSIGGAAPAVGGTASVVLAIAILKGGGGAGGFLVERSGLGVAAADLQSLAAAQGMTVLVLEPAGQLIVGASAPSAGGNATPVTRWDPQPLGHRRGGGGAAQPFGADQRPGRHAERSEPARLGSLGRHRLAPGVVGRRGVDPRDHHRQRLRSSGPALPGRCRSGQPDLRSAGGTETELIAQNALMAHAAMHDPLTGLPNRLLFNDRLQHGISNARRAGHGMALFVIDLDGFKALNDSLGHSVGDVLLKETASRLQASVRASDTVARLGGDEFAIVAVDADKADAELIEAKIHQRMDEPFTLEDGQVSVRLSIGLAVYPGDGTESAPLLRRADIDMYRDKRSRKAALS